MQDLSIQIQDTDATWYRSVDANNLKNLGYRYVLDNRERFVPIKTRMIKFISLCVSIHACVIVYYM